MYVGNITSSTSVAASGIIPFTTVYNTNTNLEATSGVVTFKAPGFYKISGILNLTGIAAGNISAQILNGSTAITDSVVSATSGATSDCITLPINKIVKVDQSGSTFGTCSVQLSAAATVTDANLVVEKIG